jgi:hypothetical protein
MHCWSWRNYKCVVGVNDTLEGVINVWRGQNVWRGCKHIVGSKSYGGHSKWLVRFSGLENTLGALKTVGDTQNGLKMHCGD